MSPKPIEISPEALVRYRWVAENETRVLAGEPLAAALASTCFGLGVVVGPSESTVPFLCGLHQVATRYGLPQALDHGPGFVSHDTEAVLARLGVRLLHGRARLPRPALRRRAPQRLSPPRSPRTDQALPLVP